jgi:exopolysaccharide production protein ExoY
MKLLHSAPHRAEAALENAHGLNRSRPPMRGDVRNFMRASPLRASVSPFHPSAQDYRSEDLPAWQESARTNASHKTGGDGSGPVGGPWKRCFDVMIAGSALLIMAPLMIAVAILILVTMGRPVFFIQQRVGFNKRTFGCFKFRSMVSNAQERLERHLAQNEEAARIWHETQKLKHDPRITWLGRVLRKSSLDELPQLFNILRGDMSCIGPRPVITPELSRYGAHADDYARARPGLTGFWQVSGRSNTTYAYRVNCDRFYVRRWSLLLDLAIMLRTIPAVLRFKETS